MGLDIIVWESLNRCPVEHLRHFIGVGEKFKRKGAIFESGCFSYETDMLNSVFLFWGMVFHFFVYFDNFCHFRRIAFGKSDD